MPVSRDERIDESVVASVPAWPEPRAFPLDEWASSLYDAVRRAFRSHSTATLPGELDLGDLSTGGDQVTWHPSQGLGAPPPRSGGWPYAALARVRACSLGVQPALADLARAVDASDRLRAWSALALLAQSHTSMRWCWYDAASCVQIWVEWLFLASRLHEIDRSSTGSVSPAPCVPSCRDREAKPAADSGLTKATWRRLCRLAGWCPTPGAVTDMARAATGLSQAATGYSSAYGALSEVGLGGTPTVEHVARLLRAGNGLAYWSATLTYAPHYARLLRRLGTDGGRRALDRDEG